MPQASRNIRNKWLKLDFDKNNNNIPFKNTTTCFAGTMLFLIELSAIICIGCMILIWINDFGHLPISKLEITGERYYTRDDNIRKAILSLGMPNTFITMDVNAIQDQIKNMSWIRHVTVHKEWPDELKIHLIEHKPYAKWNDTFFISTEGVVFTLPKSENNKDAFLSLYGPQNSQQEVLVMYHSMQQQLKPYNFVIKSVLMTTRRAWQVVLTNNIKLNIGREKVRERLNRFIRLYPLLRQVMMDKRIGYIDLRYNDSAAVCWLPKSIA